MPKFKVSNLNGPAKLAFAQFGNLRSLYITNFSNNTVSSCAIDADGGLRSGCRNTNIPGLSSPTGIATSYINGQQYIYIGNNLSRTITRCIIDQKGVIVSGSCINSGVPSSLLTGIVSMVSNRSPNSDINYLYITNFVRYSSSNPTNILRCTLNPSNGMPTNCGAIGITVATVNSPGGMDILFNDQ